ncbi:DNA polymerase beta-like [Tribolium madens]|uniref:DNA polymerase beta-like n=1 Tax=Tribolium madens TaxID=41895 RepID=UPI001CF7463F|nr:DNA polymerase beta-like [Tribolium madens]
MGKRKTPSGEETPNSDFCDFLSELAEYEKNISRNIHKYNAYRKAASVLASHPIRIKSGEESKKLNGIGEKIAKKIDEFLQTGKLQKLDNIHNDSKSTAINLLTQITGIGPAKAQNLVNEGITTLEELEKHKNKLNHHQLIGLKYYHDFKEKIPRDEIKKIENLIRSHLEPQIQLTICGSYRRGKQQSGDIDALITHPNYTSSQPKKKQNILKNVVAALQNCGLITETISLGDTKFMGACKLNQDSITRRLDIRLTPYDQYFCAVLYFTGSDMFNKEMRAHALDVGFTLNEYTLRPVGSTGVPGEPVEIHSEKDVFDCIGFPYKEPEDRNK